MGFSERTRRRLEAEPGVLMKLTAPYTLKLTGDPDAYLKCPRSKTTLWHLLDRLFAGEEVEESELQSWGLKVTLVDEFVAIKREV